VIIRLCIQLAVPLCALLATPALAELAERPVIQVISQVRSAHLELQSQGIGPGSNASHQESALSNGPFLVEFVDAVSGEEGTTANGNATQDSEIALFSIKGNGEADGSATANTMDTSAGVDAGSLVQLQFQVPVNSAFSVAGSIEATTVGLGGGGGVQIFVTGTDSLGVPFQFFKLATEQTGRVEFFYAQSVMGGTPIDLVVDARIIVTTSGTGTVSGTSRFNFTFDIGDRDCDGLLDAWEIGGIDVNDDGILDINLEANGADPDHKDLFVELDAMAGVEIDSSATDDVVWAFSLAPASMVDNPDGTEGINLHVIIDEDNLTRQTLTGDVWPAGFDALKAGHFGRATDALNSNPVDLKAARERIFRYCLWADYLIAHGDSLQGSAEIPGDDFIVAASFVADSAPTELQDALAGTFMHELGHTLGLRHGGNDGIKNKPNYLSVMNYILLRPLPATAGGWKLDYSRTLLRTLDEAALMEPLGLDGPHDRATIFNSAPNGQALVLRVVWADEVPVDWNGDMVADVNPVARDINQNTPSDPASPDQVLYGAIDWNHLWYPISGHENFGDATGRALGTIPEEPNAQDIRDLIALPFVDQRGVATAVREPTPTAAAFLLLPATPNPFNPTTEIRFHLAHASQVELKVYDLRGRLVRSLVDGEEVEAGSHVRIWDGKDSRGRSLASGVYLYRLVAGDLRSTRAMTLLK
jgi:hypothetical protein